MQGSLHHVSTSLVYNMTDGMACHNGRYLCEAMLIDQRSASALCVEN